MVGYFSSSLIDIYFDITVHINSVEAFTVDSGTEMTRKLPVKSRLNTASSLAIALLWDPREIPAARLRRKATSIIQPEKKEETINI